MQGIVMVKNIFNINVVTNKYIDFLHHVTFYTCDVIEGLTQSMFRNENFGHG